MKKCKKCGKKLNELINIQSGFKCFTCYIVDGEIEYDDSEFSTDERTNSYRCPYCDEVICKDEESAKEFLLD